MKHEVVTKILDRPRAGPEPKKGKGGPRSGSCREPECLEVPRDGKPYCTTHVGKMPYAAQVLADLAAHDKGKKPPKALLAEITHDLCTQCQRVRRMPNHSHCHRCADL